jgi:tetratricopeptide (TPR) repeat protein
MLHEKKISINFDAGKPEYELGIEALEEKNYPKALDYFNAAFQKYPGSAALFANMALSFQGLKRFNEAKLFYKKALMLAPLDQNLNLAFIQLLHAEKKYDESITFLKQIENTLTPSIEIYFIFGKSYELSGLFIEAIDYYQKALTINKEHLESLVSLAGCYMDTLQKTKCYEVIRRISKNEDLAEENLKILINLLKMNKNYNDIIKILLKKQEIKKLDEHLRSQLATAYLGVNELNNAFTLYQDIIEKNQNNVEVLQGLGEYYLLSKDYIKSEKYFKKSLNIEEQVDVYIKYYRLLHELNRFEEAEKIFLKGENLTNSKLHFYLQIAKIKMDRRLYIESIALCEKALTAYPDSIAPIDGLLSNYIELEDFEKVSFYNEIILAKIPDHETAHFSKAIACFAQKKIEEGWIHYEKRLKVKEQYHLKKDELFSESKFWQGEDLKDKTVFVWSEQGIGDEIMFASCYHDIINKAKMVIIECNKRLYSLFARSFPKAFFISQFFEMVEEEKKRVLINIEPFRPIDYAVASGSLPLHFRKKIEHFPGNRQSYLTPNPFLVKEWLNRYKKFNDNFKIGICWRSGLLTAQRQKYFLKIEDFLPIFLLPHITFINLQYDDCEKEIQSIEQNHPVRLERWPDVNLKDDFENVAAMMVNLDLIITSETAVGELGAALGVEVWRLTGGSDWTRLGQKERPWYPTMRSFVRVGEEKWAPLIDQIVEMLKEKMALK